MTAVRARDGVSITRVDDRGILARSADEAIVDVAFDGRRIFSYWLQRDGRPDEGGHLMPWPPALREFLTGTTQVTLSVHGTAAALYDEDVRLGPGEGRIAVVTDDGLPLALDKYHRRVQTFDTRSDEQIKPLMDAIGDVLGALREEGIEAFLAYGTALGAIRDGKLIGHDSDADLGYVSRHEHPVAVMRESFDLQRALVRRGYPVQRYSGAAFKVDVREPDGSMRGLDVFGGFLFGGHLHLMGEIRTPFQREWILPLTEATLEGRTFPVPHDTDRFLTATYGPSWRVPDPAFHFETPESTHRRLNGWFRGIRVRRDSWAAYYSRPANRKVSERPTDLAAWVAEREDDVSHVVDLGCGPGGDVRWWARRGVEAVGLDFVPRAFAETAEQVQTEGLEASYRFFNLLELRSVLATSALLAQQPGPRTVTARHLVDGLNRPGREGLWRTADLLTRGGGRFFLQFLVAAGEDGLAKRERVSPIPAEDVAAELAAAGATILHREVLPATDGTSPSRICRMVAQWVR